MAKRFAGAMASFVNAHGNAPSLLAEHYPWDSIGNGTVVDVGGSKGHISVLLAQRYPDLNFVVQDLPEALTGAAEAVPSEVADRIKFQEHDFFMPQTVQADVYLFRNIFHNWPDAFAINILQQLVPALRKGSRIVIHDYLLPRPGALPWIKEMAVR
jgi:SAM-dependent methyltransferase